MKLVSKFKLETAVEEELKTFLSGFWEVSVCNKNSHALTMYSVA